MTELDLGLKVASRRLLWRMGFSTRIDVELRTFIPAGSRAKHESLTDLDVLGVFSAPGFALRTVVVDCKTSQRRSTERMFWIRGVADFFEADDAWMVRSRGVTAAARQLSARLGISVLEETDLKLLESHHPIDLRLDLGPLAPLFDRASVSRYTEAFTTLNKKLDSLLEYCRLDYWVYNQHTNLLQVVAHLEEVADNLNPTHKTHRALFYECSWLYTLSLAYAAANVRAAHLTDVDAMLQQYIFGGQVALEEKRRLAAVLRHLAPESAVATDDGVLPSWYPQLLELLKRHLECPYALNDELRYAEWLSEAQQMKETATVAVAFEPTIDGTATKLLADVCGFLVRVAGLDSGFHAHVHAVLG